MTLRTAVGLAAFLSFAALLAHTTAATQCPARQLGPCAKVHALMREPVVRLAAAPLRGGEPAPGPFALAAAHRR